MPGDVGMSGAVKGAVVVRVRLPFLSEIFLCRAMFPEHADYAGAAGLVDVDEEKRYGHLPFLLPACR
eukprot:CAMPEP_0172540910 /NCGR_PEP_ID=MMETSP1067-20121228/11809_1 /TAXON_ID=265564 ORGANISM="Thalassiosira punctigera, Strain Tpunct2005C2" /NCGR_SAMPLE_ID=MMETSP1067 /ASSEMBLY_ACC=CAM_ASM_000444 /LENGTH=66 /DNA_ID=CAMNT_0013326843 /DNA_START=728 /DNA_END=928 /DNA_ORIENTATION=+